MGSHHGSNSIDQVVVVMVPLPAQGHLNQLLHLSRLISGYNIPVHFASTAVHNRQAKVRVHGWNPNEIANIHFHDFEIPCFSKSPYPIPTIAASAGDSKFPSHLIPALRAVSIGIREPLIEFLRSISSETRRIVIIHDSLMASAIQGIDSISSNSNIESYKFHSVSAFALALFCLERNGVVLSPLANLNIPSLEGCFPQDFLDLIDFQYQIPNVDSGKIYNTSELIEGAYLEILKNSMGKEMKHWALGPFNPVKISAQKQKQKPINSCLEFLDRQQPNSVIYVSFGTTTAMEVEQIREIAVGLEKSEQKFIWVLRNADQENVFHYSDGGGGGERKTELWLPDGYEKTMRERERGLIVRDWAPQLEILSHSSTGGFMSHCGWNSCMESITMGVPVAAWPMHSDQPRNTALMTEVLQVGLVVKPWDDRRDELVTSVTIEKVVRKIMATEEGHDMRKRAAALGAAVRRSVEEGGASRKELNSFIAHIRR